MVYYTKDVFLISYMLLNICICVSMDSLQELIQQMANVQYTENMTEDQLDAMAGSDTLRYQATSFGMTRNNKVLFQYTESKRTVAHF